MYSSKPLLVVDRIERSSERISVHLRLGGRPVRVEIGLEVPGLFAYEQVPDVIDRHLSARKAMLELVARTERGEDVPLPADLSDLVRRACEPWPLRLPSAAEQETMSAGTSLSSRAEVMRTEPDTPEPGLVTVVLRVGGEDARVVIDPREGPQRELRFRFVEGAHPWLLTPADGDAMLRALVGALRRA